MYMAPMGDGVQVKEAVRQWDVSMHVGHGKVNSNCFPNSETIAIFMATNVTVSDVCMTREWFACSVVFDAQI